jgi:acyl-CoA hydrolase
MAADYISARDAALLGKQAQRILLGGCTADPVAVLNAVRAEPDLWQDRNVTGLFIPGVNDRAYADIGQGTRVETIFATPGLRDHARVDHLPLHYTAFGARLSRPGVIDLVYVTVPPPRADGTIGLGLTCDVVPGAVAAGARLVGIVSPRMPDVANGPRLPRSRFTALVDDDSPLPELTSVTPDAESLTIADHVISLLRAGDTIQLGLGKLQPAVLSRLAASGLHDLGYHGGMVTPGIVPLVLSGQMARGVTTGVALGDAGFYERVATLPQVCFAPFDQTHGMAALSAIPSLVTINSVIEVDLTGQANAETLGQRQISGQGGLVDFLRGARASAGGRAILALPATANRGQTSRIVAALGQGTPVSVARGDVDIVVTEFGVAHLREASLAERRDRLAAIAAPAFRHALTRGDA